jgi:type 2 lantibiotic biosynthesis protein LanM
MPPEDHLLFLDPLPIWQQQAWLAAVAPDEPHKLGRRIKWDALDPTTLERQWSEQELRPDINRDPILPLDPESESASWWPALKASLDVLQANWDLPLLPYDHKGKQPFVDLWWPICCFWANRLKQALVSLPSDWIQMEEVIDQLADSLLSRLCAIGEQVLWQRFSSGRTPGMMLLAHLGTQGDGSGPLLREHYQAFIFSQRREGLSSLLREYLVLGRLIGTAVTFWYQGSEELLHRVSKDRKILVTHFNLTRGHRLCALTQGLSDPHHGGRSVAILLFSPERASDYSAEEDSALETDDHSKSAGPEALGVVRIVYKPKDMRLDAAFHAALADLNAHSSLPALRIIAVHASDGYGYMEYVPHQTCADETELERFYTNAGRLTAVLHALGCTDCHHENMIACSDQLLLIDTETLLEPDMSGLTFEEAAQSPATSPSHIQRRLRGSVLRSGLLPQWRMVGAGRRSFDISAMGVRAPMEALHPSPGWLGVNSDGMLPGRVLRSSVLPTSLPVGIGVSNPFHKYLESFCAGFESQCLAFLAHKQRLLAPDGALSRFCGLSRRIVLRATRVYFTIQHQMLAPEALRSPFAHSMVLEQLARSYLLSETRPLHWPVFAAEVRQMKRLDIPFFTHQIDGDALYLCDDQLRDQAIDASLGIAKLSGFFRTSGLAAARERLLSLSCEEIAFQLRLIRGAASVLGTDQGSPAEPEVLSCDTARFATQAQQTDSLEAARSLAQQLLELAIADPDGEIDWLGMDLGADGESFRFGLVGPTLYGGSIGIASLLQRLHSLGAELHLTTPENLRILDSPTIIASILRPLRELVADQSGDWCRRWWRDQPLGISGCGGVILALHLLQEQDLVESLLQAALPRAVQSDLQLDLIGGCAGLIGPLLRQPGKTARMLALAAGERLLQRQNQNGSWSLTTHRPGLLGFSHGTAGFAAALAHLYEFSGDPRYHTAAAAALNYERSRFDKQQNNWPDYRRMDSVNTSPTFMVGWCHGAPGIAFGRACLWGTALWDDQCIEEISTALRTTAAIRDVGSDHLCCGSLGLMAVLELLIEGPWPIEPLVRDLSHEAAQKLRERALRSCVGTPLKRSRLLSFSSAYSQLILPGFFNGLSGMGLALLEDPDSRTMLASLLSAGFWPGSDGAAALPSRRGYQKTRRPNGSTAEATASRSQS